MAPTDGDTEPDGPDRRLVLGLSAGGWALSQGTWLLLPALAVPIRETLDIGNAAFGAVMTVLWAAIALTQFPSGLLSDELGHRTVLVPTMLAAGVTVAALAWLEALPAFLILVVFVGVGTGAFPTVARALLSSRFGEDRGRAFGVFGGAGDAAGVATPLVATAAIAAGVWRVAFLAVGAAVVLAAAGFHVLLAGDYDFRRPPVLGPGRDSFAEVLRPGVPVAILCYSTFALVWQGSTSFLPLYMYEAKGLTLARANGMLSVLFLMGMLVKPAAGWVSDLVGRRSLVVGSLFVAGCLLAGLALLARRPVVVVATVAAFGGALMTFQPVMQAYLMDWFEGASEGGAFGLARLIYATIASVGSTVVGVGSGTVGYDAVFAVLAVGLIVASVALLFTTARVADPATA
ncbi:MAG: MFS transporter [Haloarculaceae archaeon]